MWTSVTWVRLIAHSSVTILMVATRAAAKMGTLLEMTTEHVKLVKYDYKTLRATLLRNYQHQF